MKYVAAMMVAVILGGCEKPVVAPKPKVENPYPAMPVLPEDKDAFACKDIQVGVTTEQEVAKKLGVSPSAEADEPWASSLSVYSDAKLTIADRPVKWMTVHFLDGVVSDVWVVINKDDTDHVLAAMTEKLGEPEINPFSQMKEWKNAVSCIHTATTDKTTSIDYYHTRRRDERSRRRDEPKQEAIKKSTKDL